ncbi:MAG TPA: hypothetical protein VGQ41_15355 [Pyrinomonadaceae bacterium]|jgi:hypothetical protein|nr:hypothetical protein [Pyrinomonadaceae bacterium]
MRIRLFSLLLISMMPTLVVYSQGEKKPRTVDDYRLTTLRELSARQPEYVVKEPNYKDARLIVQADIFPSRVKVVYDGTKRPLLDIKKTVIRSWANHFAGAPEFYINPYETEMLFVENGEGYWLVVRKEFVPQFEQELKKGDAIELLLIKMGGIRIDDKLEPVILVEKFLKL